jgi:uncharacterized protein
VVVDFEWDPKKAASNISKHDTTFEAASRVFQDPLKLETEQHDDSGELRYGVIGMVDGRLLHVTYTMRGDVTRIISARAAESYERRQYHEV